MQNPRASIALLVDFANLRQGAADSGAADSGAAGSVAADSPAADRAMTGDAANEGPRAGSDVARALVRFASGGGRVGLARAYADWTRDPDGARDLNGTRLEPIMVPATDDGEDRSHIRLVVDAMDTLRTGAHPDAFVLVSGDPTLVPLAQALRSTGSDVVVVVPDGTADELAAEADVCVPLGDVVEGRKLDSVTPRGRDESNKGQATNNGHAGGHGNGRDTRSDRKGRDDRRVPYFDPGHGNEPDFSSYEWSHFVQLIDELEERLPFVGVRYLVNKVLGAHNCGIDDPRLKRDLINQSVDEGIIELYTVGNVDDRLDPVTACRLDRKNDVVLTVIGEDDLEDDEDFEPFEEDISTPSAVALD